ncbi:hypothetical protein QUA54_09355 [Microcoleus sp. MOSTC5]|uniref:hypothetical protein n=1 Tax=Microcoleus sp. MOSTC5 TaxID=3055378 RepID=UPI002FD5A800
MMSNNPLKSTTTDFESHASALAEAWLILMQEKQYHEASRLCIDFLENYSSAFKVRALEIDEDGYNKLLILLVFFKGLHEDVQLCQIINDRNWYEDNTTVEQVWRKLCDCRERIQFSSQYCQSKAINRVFSDLDDLEEFFRAVFGNGCYLSPGIIADASLCNICNEDCRGCSHIAGRLYSGKICFYQLVNPLINHVALVKIPKDLRCRIWSWQIKDNEDKSSRIDAAPILTLFSVDNFLRDSEAELS